MGRKERFLTINHEWKSIKVDVKSFRNETDRQVPNIGLDSRIQKEKGKKRPLSVTMTTIINDL